MESNIEYIYKGFRNVLTGCSTLLDATYFSMKIIEKNPETADLVRSMINGKNYYHSINMSKIRQNLIELDNCVYRDEVEEKIDRFSKESYDPVQQKAFTRIIRLKPTRPLKKREEHIYKFKKDVKLTYITKSCPHCKRECKALPETNYIICGKDDINNDGFDWLEADWCGKEWCFSCGKILCRGWMSDMLDIVINKPHDSKCCKEHAKKNNNKYPEDYCQCINEHVKRND